MVSTEYLAGFIDGEGYLALGRILRRNWSVEYPVRLVVYNTNGRILEEIQDAWGGTLSFSESRNPRWKPQHALIWTNAAAARVLAEVAPYLRVKSRQAGVLLDFQNHLRGRPRIRDRRGRLLSHSKQEMKLRESLYQHLKSLNARGPRAQIPLRPVGPYKEGRRKKHSSVSAKYLAGFMDGEGSLMIVKRKGRGSWKAQYRARISISNTDRVVLEDIQDVFGGIIADQPPARAGWKQAYQLVWSGGMVERLLSKAARHLRLKQRQAAVMEDFVLHQKSTRQPRRGPNRRFFAALPDNVVTYREGLYRQMKELNARGLATTRAQTGTRSASRPPATRAAGTPSGLASQSSRRSHPRP